MPLARTMLQTLFLFAAMHVLQRFRGHSPGLGFISEALSPGAFLPFAASVAAGLNNHKSLVFLIIGMIIVFGWPFDLPEFARQLLPVAAGVIVGAGGRRLLMENQEASWPQNNNPSSSNTKTSGQ
jgi:hypothetical protein